MKLKAVSGMMLTLLFVGMLTLAVDIQPVKASGTIYIRADGSVDPDTAPISTVDHVTYTFTGNINDSIVIERDDIVVDGAGYIVQGTGAPGSKGIDLPLRDNVTVKNAEIKLFETGIFLYSTSNSLVYRNTLTNNIYCITLVAICFYNTLDGNVITNSTYGIIFLDSLSNVVSNNIVESNTIGIHLWGADFGCHSNLIYHNDFINNTYQASIRDDVLVLNDWNAGYLSGGNYWSDYTGVDEKSDSGQDQPGSDGIGDTPYTIHIGLATNRDRYPLMKRINLAARAAQLAKAVIGANYGWAAKGWNSTNGGRFLNASDITSLDCSGLVYWSYNKVYGATKYSPWDKKSYAIIDNKTKVKSLNLILFENAKNQYRYNVDNITKNDLYPGDLLFFDKLARKYDKRLEASVFKWGWPNGIMEHVAMYVGPFEYEGKTYNVVHASGFAKKVVAAQYDPESEILTTVDSKGEEQNLYVDGYGRVKFPVIISLARFLKILSESPVNLNVTCPEGFTITNDTRENPDIIYPEFDIGDGELGPDMIYLEFDVNGDDELDDMVVVLERKVGDYFITVIPEPEASPTDTYTLEVSFENTTTVMDENVPLSEIPGLPYIVTSNETTITPRLDPHDIGITWFDPSKTVVGQNSSLYVNVTIFNYGQFTETFNITLYANTTIIATFTSITLTSKSSTHTTFTWNTTGFAYGNYTLNAYAWPVSNETYTTDNTFVYGMVFVTITGDVNGDFSVETSDLFDLSKVYGYTPEEPNWNPNCDFNDDNKIDASDLFDLGKNFGKTV